MPHLLLLALMNQGDEQVFNVFIFSPDKNKTHNKNIYIFLNQHLSSETKAGSEAL